MGCAELDRVSEYAQKAAGGRSSLAGQRPALHPLPPTLEELDEEADRLATERRRRAEVLAALDPATRLMVELGAIPLPDPDADESIVDDDLAADLETPPPPRAPGPNAWPDLDDPTGLPTGL